MDAISLLKDDHRSVERLFKRFEKTSDRAEVERRRIVDDIIKELSVHAEIEETVFYPAVREAVPPTEDTVLESLEEHHVVKWVLSELDGMPADAERFEAKVAVLMENVRHHVKEEESDLFPKVRRALSRKALNEMGEAMQRAKLVAPTRPHPRSPDTPPGNIVTGVVAAALDRARDAGQELVEGATGAARRAAANATGGDTPAKRTGRTTATKRTTAKRAKRAKKATGAGRRTTKRATGSAKKGTRATKATARKTTARSKATARKATARKATGATKRSTGATKRTATKASRTTKATGRTAAGTTKRTTKKAGGAAKGSARKTTSRPRKAAKKRG